MIWVIVLLSIAVSVVVAFTFNVPILRVAWIRMAGAIIIIAGMLVRGLAVYQLGKYFTVDVTIRQQHTHCCKRALQSMSVIPLMPALSFHFLALA